MGTAVREAGEEPRRRLLCLSTYPESDASVRHRFLAYCDAIRAEGWSVEFDSVLSDRLFGIKNRTGLLATAEKLIRLAWGLGRRVWLLRSITKYDAIWIHREAFPFLTPLFERAVARRARGRVVLDFDDALYARPPAGRDWRSRWRDPGAYPSAVRAADRVVVGSPVLADWVAGLGARATYVPTCVDTMRLEPRRVRPDGPLTVGWVGSWSTADSLSMIAGAFRRLRDVEDARLLLVGAANLARLESLIPSVEWRLWSADREVLDLSEFDIGVMPLEDTPWNRGKCAFKLIQYMAMGIPCVASPVGMNADVVTASGAGLLCRTEDEWTGALIGLARDSAKRELMGNAGRRYAVTHFDYRGHAPTIVEMLVSG